MEKTPDDIYTAIMSNNYIANGLWKAFPILNMLRALKDFFQTEPSFTGSGHILLHARRIVPLAVLMSATRLIPSRPG